MYVQIDPELMRIYTNIIKTTASSHCTNEISNNFM